MAEDKGTNVRGWKDLPPMPVSTGSMAVNDTGSWRNAEPVYTDHTPPCNFKCPAGNDVAGFLRLTSEGKYREAWELIRQTSPFPGVCGRVCPHPCESECNRLYLGGHLKIHAVERFLADRNMQEWTELSSIKYRDQSVAVIGSGPAGLSCAWHLNRMGYKVTVFEKHSWTGGMMRLGIPNFRLPKDILNREIKSIERAGVKIITGVGIGRDLEFSELRSQFEAVFISVGFHNSYSLGIEGEDHPDIVSGTSFLREHSLGNKVDLKKRVLVVGGGNTAMDTARTALRLGADPMVIYRRTREEMPAIAEEIDETMEEGIPIEFLTAPVTVMTDSGKITGVECLRMKLGDPDSSGRRRPVPIEGSNFTIEADQVFTAIGETADLSFLGGDVQIEKWGVTTDEFGRTNVPGIFAGGDAATGEGTVSHAIGSGRKTALAIEAYLKDETITEAELNPPSLQNVSPQVVTFDQLNIDYFDNREPVPIRGTAPDNRKGNFEEIHGTLSEKQALYESQRCMSCGSCPECDNCLIFCPDAAVKHVENQSSKYLIDMKHCKGCGLCVSECPRYCMELHPVR